MTYREPGEKGDDPEARLRARADEGWRRRELAKTTEQSQRAAKRSSSRPRNLRNAVVGESVAYWAIAAIAIGVSAVRAYVLFDHARVTAMVWLFGGIAVFGLSPFPLGLWLVPRERAFVRALPFEVNGYFENLESDPSRNAHVKVSVELTSKPSKALATQLVTWAAAAGAEVNETDGTVVDFMRQDISSNDKGGPTNAPMWRAQRRLVSRLLLPIHAKAKIRSVTFSRDL